MDKVIFRSSMAGYNKKDVNKYISGVDARHASEMAAASANATKLKGELDVLKGEDEELRRELENAKTRAEELRLKLESSEGELEALRQKCLKAEEEAASHAKEATALRGMLADVPSDMPSAEELCELRRRAAAYDELDSRRLTAPQAGAVAEADNVIRSAYNEAERIRAEARSLGSAAACEEIKGQMSGELCEIYELINRTAAESLDDILANMRSAEAGVGKLSEELYDKNRTAVVRVEKLRAEIERLIEQKLAEAELAADNAGVSADVAGGSDANAKTSVNSAQSADKKAASSAAADNAVKEANASAMRTASVASASSVSHRSSRRGQEMGRTASKQHRDDGFFRFGRRK